MPRNIITKILLVFAIDMTRSTAFAAAVGPESPVRCCAHHDCTTDCSQWVPNCGTCTSVRSPPSTHWIRPFQMNSQKADCVSFNSTFTAAQSKSWQKRDCFSPPRATNKGGEHCFLKQVLECSVNTLET